MQKRRKRAESERVNWLIQNYKQLFDQGYSVAEITDIARVHYTTVYHALDKIAELNHCSRNDLLRRVHRKHTVLKPFVRTKTQVKISEVEENISEILYLCDEIDKTIDNLTRKENEHE